MKKDFSTHWKSSKQPRKQRKYLANAPLHTKRKLVSSHLSKELREKHGKRNIPVRVGDVVKVLRGQFKKKSGKVSEVNIKQSNIFIEGIEQTRKEGKKSPIPINPSNVIIQELNLDDKKRKKALERK